MPETVTAAPFMSEWLHGVGSYTAGRDVDLLWHGQAISVDIGPGRILHVSDERSTGFFAGRGGELSGRQSGKVSQHELLGRRKPKRHSDQVDDDIAKASTLEQVTELRGVSKREPYRASARRLGTKEA